LPSLHEVLSILWDNISGVLIFLFCLLCFILVAVTKTKPKNLIIDLIGLIVTGLITLWSFFILIWSKSKNRR